MSVIPIRIVQFPATNPERINILVGVHNTVKISKSVDLVVRIAFQNLNATSLYESSKLGQCFNAIMDSLKETLERSKTLAA
jgi:hypothetical protein